MVAGQVCLIPVFERDVDGTATRTVPAAVLGPVLFVTGLDA
jgi:hypothetical protein